MVTQPSLIFQPAISNSSPTDYAAGQSAALVDLKILLALPVYEILNLL